MLDFLYFVEKGIGIIWSRASDELVTGFEGIGIIWSRASDELVTGFEGTEASALEKWTSHRVSQDWSV